MTCIVLPIYIVTFVMRYASASEITYIVSSGALNSTHSLWDMLVMHFYVMLC